jgi:hypothetical protein
VYSRSEEAIQEERIARRAVEARDQHSERPQSGRFKADSGVDDLSLCAAGDECRARDHDTMPACRRAFPIKLQGSRR